MLSRIQLLYPEDTWWIISGENGEDTFDTKRICRVPQRIALGLHWYHRQDRQRPNSDVEVFIKIRPDIGQVSELLPAMTRCNIGCTTFRDRHGRPHDALECSVWGMQFYEGAHFLVTNVGQPLAEEYDTYAGRAPIT